MNTVRNIWASGKIVLNFVKRHFLTLILSGYIASAFIEGPINFLNSLILLSLAAIFDWNKMKTRTSHDYHRLGEVTPTLQSQSPCNYHMVGTASYLSNIGHH